MKKLVLVILILFLVHGCVPPNQGTIIETQYVPASQVAVPPLTELQTAAAQGNAAAQYEMGKLYAQGLGVPRSHRKAVDYWKTSAQQGYGPAQYSLGLMYFNGTGITIDFREGCRWMGAAGAQGIPEAIAYYNKYCISVQ